MKRILQFFCSLLPCITAAQMQIDSVSIIKDQIYYVDLTYIPKVGPPKGGYAIIKNKPNSNSYILTDINAFTCSFFSKEIFTLSTSSSYNEAELYLNKNNDINSHLSPKYEFKEADFNKNIIPFNIVFKRKAQRKEYILQDSSQLIIEFIKIQATFFKVYGQKLITESYPGLNFDNNCYSRNYVYWFKKVNRVCKYTDPHFFDDIFK